MSQLYYDTFSNEFTRTTDTIAAPERYVKVFCGEDECNYIEKWFVGNGNSINVEYTLEEYMNGLVNDKREDAEKANNVILKFMEEWTITKEHYQKIEEFMASQEE